MPNIQPDLFSGSGLPAAPFASSTGKLPCPAPADLDDAALLAAIPSSGISDGPKLAAEAGRRRLATAIPVLMDYCRRFAGFGVQHALPEQIAALNALGTIGGLDAAHAVAQIISSAWVQGPTLASAAAVAARLQARLPANVVLTLLRHADPAIRANACRLARPGPDITETLIDLLGDLHPEVNMAAACTLGRMGRQEARPLLMRALRQAPSLSVVEAVPQVADEDCVVLLGRIARTSPDLATAARDAIEASEHPIAARVLAGLGGP